MKINYINFLFLAAVLIGLNTADVSAQETKIERFDKAFYNYLQNPTKPLEVNLAKEYPDLLPAFMQIAQSNNSQKVDFATLRSYFGHPMLNTIYKDEQRILADLSVNEKALEKASGLIKEYLPNKKSLPQFAIHVSGFKENAIVLDGLVSISGDRYLGSSYQYYQDFFSSRERSRMQSNAIARDLLKAWIISENIVQTEKTETLMSAMVREGKILYLLSKLLPDCSEEEITLFYPADVKQFEKYKSEIWNKILRNNDLLSKDKMLIAGFIDENPRILPISGKTPTLTGAMFGWEIVKKYAQQPNVSIQEILNADATQILKIVRYAP